jgi:uncharacterized protein
MSPSRYDLRGRSIRGSRLRAIAAQTPTRQRSNQRSYPNPEQETDSTMTDRIERRDFPATFAVSALSPTESRDGAIGRTISGHSAVFSALSEDLGGFTEIILPGAFANVLRSNPNVVMLFDHAGIPLARTASGTLRIWEDSIGLADQFTLGSSPYASSIREAVQRGDLASQSFSFVVRKDKWAQVNGVTLRSIIEVSKLWDCSLVSSPAYSSTDVTMRQKPELLDARTMADYRRELASAKAIEAPASWAVSLRKRRLQLAAA